MNQTPSPVIFLDPLNKNNTLSDQLMKHTGSPFSTKDFYSEHLGEFGNTTPAGVLVHRESGMRLFVPIKAYPGQENDLETLTELVRIERFCGGTSGYQWGNTRHKDGNYGGNKLDALEEMGLAVRTGGKHPNGLGGTWPEVEVTQRGHEVIKAYIEWNKNRAHENENNNELR